MTGKGCISAHTFIFFGGGGRRWHTSGLLPVVWEGDRKCPCTLLPRDLCRAGAGWGQGRSPPSGSSHLNIKYSTFTMWQWKKLCKSRRHNATMKIRLGGGTGFFRAVHPTIMAGVSKLIFSFVASGRVHHLFSVLKQNWEKWTKVFRLFCFEPKKSVFYLLPLPPQSPPPTPDTFQTI
jgi:hypothetical protein